MRSTSSLAALAAALCLMAGCASAYEGIGDQVAHTFLKFDKLPLTSKDAVSAGWSQAAACDSTLGIRYTSKALSDHYPISAYYTAGGQIAGVSVDVFGTPNTPDLVPVWWKPVGSNQYRCTVTFRTEVDMCSSDTYAAPLGESLTVNADGIAFPIPVTAEGATEIGYAPGGCISGMGRHWSYDLVSHPTLSFNASYLMPVTPMYDDTTGNVNAFLFLAPVRQQDQPFLGYWEGPFIPSLLCYNWCDKSCSGNMGKTSVAWNTMHFMLHDHSLNKCPQGHCPSS